MRTWKERNRQLISDKEFELGAGIVRINDDLDDYFSVGLLHKINNLFDRGYDLEEIGEMFNRDPYEILLAVIHLARHHRINRPIAFRYRNRKNKRVSGKEEKNV